jgi:hypothetical protein
VVVWENDAETDTIMTAFATKTVDISAIADNQAEVTVRFGLASSDSVEFGGWNVGYLKIEAWKDNTTEYAWLLGATDDITTVSEWVLEGGIDPLTKLPAAGWAVGTPVPVTDRGGGGGQEVLDSGGVGTGEFVGFDPEEANTDTFVLGYVVGGNYQRNMAPRYATSPLMDFVNSKAVKLTFFQWLEVEDAAADTAAIQVNTDGVDTEVEVFASDFSEDTIGDYIVAGPTGGTATGTAVVNTSDEVIELAGPVSVAKAIDTTEFYELTGTISLGTEYDITGPNGAGDNLKVQWTDGTLDISSKLVWQALTIIDPDDNPVTTLTGSNDMADYTFSIPRQSVGTDPKGEDNAKVQIRIVSTADSNSKDSATIGGIELLGANWLYLWKNPATTPPENTFDDEWTEESFSLADFDVDGNAIDDAGGVTVRFQMGPTDNFIPKSGQQATEFGGWSLDDIAFTDGTLWWRSESYDLPVALEWEAAGDVAITLKNMGTGYWDDTFLLNEVAGPTGPVKTPLLYVGVGTEIGAETMIERYDVGQIALEDTVDPNATVDLAATLTAPPLTTIAYLTEAKDGTPTSPGDAKTSVIGANWYFFHGDDGDIPVDLYDDLSMLPSEPYDANPDTPKGTLTISRFPDIQPGASADENQPGFWARYWIEELAGRVPFVVKGFPEPDGTATYRPLVALTRDALAVYIQRAKALEKLDPIGVFKDVPVKGVLGATTTHWAAAEIEAVWRAHIVTGYPPDFTTYQPATEITRDGMAKFIAIGAGLPGNGDTAAAVKADWEDYAADNDDDLPFNDVALDVPGSTPGTSVPNPFLPYINACWLADVVQGFTKAPGGRYGPSETTTRDQLAVFVWRAFMRPSGTPVVLAGPAITGVEAPEDAAWIGFPQVSVANAWKDENTMYVTFDAMRLKDDMVPTSVWRVKFELRDAAKPTVPALPELTWIFEKNGTELNDLAAEALATGSPYGATFFQLIPAATPTPANALAEKIHGNFVFVVSVQVPTGTPSTTAWAEALRTAPYKSYGRFFYEPFESGAIGLDKNGVVGWKVSGLPALAIQVLSGKPALNANDKTTAPVHCAVLTQTQEMRRRINTTGWKNLNIQFYIGASDLGAGDTFAVQYSTDGGVVWNDISGGSLSDVAKASALSKVKLTKVSADLPSAAALNPNFWIRVKMTGSSTDNKGLIDSIQIKGT